MPYELVESRHIKQDFERFEPFPPHCIVVEVLVSLDQVGLLIVDFSRKGLEQEYQPVLKIVERILITYCPLEKLQISQGKMVVAILTVEDSQDRGQEDVLTHLHRVS